jgi:hypothetical protein
MFEFYSMVIPLIFTEYIIKVLVIKDKALQQNELKENRLDHDQN